MKRYIIAGVADKADVLRLGDEAVIHGLTEKAPYQWTFTYKEETIFPFEDKVVYWFERWEED